MVWLTESTKQCSCHVSWLLFWSQNSSHYSSLLSTLMWSRGYWELGGESGISVPHGLCFLDTEDKFSLVLHSFYSHGLPHLCIPTGHSAQRGRSLFFVKVTQGACVNIFTLPPQTLSSPLALCSGPGKPACLACISRFPCVLLLVGLHHQEILGRLRCYSSSSPSEVYPELAMQLN